jgi:transcriptional regulator with XRE-family HTH domain
MAEHLVSTQGTRVRFSPPALLPSGGLATLPKVKTRERELARELRRAEGASIKDIARRVGVSVSSVSAWVRDIELTPQQHAALQLRNVAYNRQRSGTCKQAAKRRAERVSYQDEGRALARAADPLYVAGCMLFWAEGGKARNAVRFTNSDPEMVRFFLRFLRTCFEIEDEHIRLTCNLFADHLERQREIERFWLRVAALPETCLCKSSVNVYSKYSQKKRQNKLPYGTCRIAVSRTRIVQSIYGAIQEIGGFTREAWLE